MMEIFGFTGVPTSPDDMQSIGIGRQYSYADLKPYTRSPEDEAEYARCLKPYRMFPEAALDDRFDDFKVRLAAALDRAGLPYPKDSA